MNPKPSSHLTSDGLIQRCTAFDEYSSPCTCPICNVLRPLPSAPDTEVAEKVAEGRPAEGIGTEMTTHEELKWMQKFHWVLMATGEGAACQVVQGTNIIRELHDFSCCCGNADTCTDEARIGTLEDLKDKDQWGTDESGDLFQWSFDHECGHVCITRVDQMPSPSTEDDPCKMTDSRYEEYIYGPNRAKWPTNAVLTDAPAAPPVAEVAAPAKEMSEGDKGFIRGVAWGIALKTRWQLNADQVLRESGVPLTDFISAGVIEHDLKPIRKLFKESR